MSQWTHITGTVRIDAFLLDHKLVKSIVKKCFGNTCHYNSKPNEWDKCNVPCGSEGSLQYDIIYSGYQHKKGKIESSSVSWGTVQIWGDLRNYDDHEEIYQWLCNIVKKLNKNHLDVRDMVIKINIEYQSDYIVTIQGENDKVVKICISK